LSEEEIVNAVLSFDVNPLKIVEELTKALRIAGKKFEDGEFFLMHPVAAAEPVRRVIKEVFEPDMINKLSTCLPMEIVEGIVVVGLRDKVKLIFGGAPVTEQRVKEIGGDGYAENAMEAVYVAKQLLKVES
jgi:methanogenic corrinoid protein MtbC1